MMMLISAALAAAQPAPAPAHHGSMGQMDPKQHEAMHEAMKEKCCCDHMAKHEGHQSGTKPHDHDGE